MPVPLWWQQQRRSGSGYNRRSCFDELAETEAINDRLAGIGKVTEDVTQSVFDKTFRPPAGSWTLLAHWHLRRRLRECTIAESG
ncbi:hypothetical protein [Novipirellula rosea]|uniref:hypothetical protein n=1 Tax=Novipirellula rosea TaxID=1031540 RepID=UPI0031EF6348